MLDWRRFLRRPVNRAEAKLLRFLEDLLLEVYSSPNRWVRRVGQQPVSVLLRWAVFWFTGLSYQVVVLRGCNPETHQPWTVACILNGNILGYLEHILFEDGQASHEERGTCSAWQIRKVARQLAREAEMIVVCRPRIPFWKPADGDWLIVPTGVRMVYDYAPGETWEQMKHKLISQEKNIKKVVRGGFSWHTSFQEEDFDFFYHRMHVPNVANRHKGYGTPEKQSDLYRDFKRGMMVFVDNAQGEPVSGKVAMIIGDVYWGVCNGVIDGSHEWLEKGAVAALYYFTIRWCLEHHIRRYDIGNVKPFIQDGIYLHKKHWKFWPARDPFGTRELMFWSPNRSPAALRWFEAHPAIPQVEQHNGERIEALYETLQVGEPAV